MSELNPQISGRLWYMNCRNNDGKGYSFTVDSINDLLKRKGMSSFRFEFSIDDGTDNLYTAVAISGKVCGIMQFKGGAA